MTGANTSTMSSNATRNSSSSFDTTTTTTTSTNNVGMSCTMKDFIFYDTNGDIVNGTLLRLDDTTTTNSNGNSNGLSSSLSSSSSSSSSLPLVCIFEKANCDPTGTTLPHECCSYNQESINNSSHSSSGSWSKKYMILCVLYPIYYLKNSIQKNNKKNKTNKNKMKSKKNKISNNDNEDDDEEKEEEDEIDNNTNRWDCK